MEILKVEHVTKIYGSGENAVRALQDVSFTVPRGEFTAIVGESGSGKSTLLNCIGGLDDPTDGKVYINGTDLFAMTEKKRTIFRRRNIGFVFQSFQLIPEPDPTAVEEVLKVLGLADRRRHLPGQLSGGQQQRVAIGRALITKPMLILADEPTGNLDSKSSQDVMELLTAASRKYRQTILMITHNMNLTASVDRVLHVSDGILTDLGGKRNEKLS